MVPHQFVKLPERARVIRDRYHVLKAPLNIPVDNPLDGLPGLMAWTEVGIAD
jgi:hypothetical protein